MRQPNGSPNRFWIQSPLPFDFVERPVGSGAPEELVLLLHGFEEKGERMLRKLGHLLPATAHVLAPNGPFPLPRRTDAGFQLGYTWYFYDRSRQEYFLDMRVAIEFVVAGLKSLGLDQLPARVIGFSQGGYLAPFVAGRLPRARQVIGISCEYLSDEFPGPMPFPIDGVHGRMDDVVPVSDALETHKGMLARGSSGVLEVVDGSGHKIDDRISEKVAELLRLRTPESTV